MRRLLGIPRSSSHKGLPTKLEDLLWEIDQEEWFYRMLLKGKLFRRAKDEEPEEQGKNGVVRKPTKLPA